MEIQYVKALHLIFVVSWFAGLFYIVRLFIYHTEAKEEQIKDEQKWKVLDPQFRLMEWRLWNIITWPAAILATALGYYMVYLLQNHGATWMITKIGLTTGLWGYHLCNHWLFKKLQKGETPWSSNRLRFWNELAAMFLVSIVFVVVLKNALNWIYATIGFFALGVVLMLAIRWYKRLRGRQSK